MAITFSQDELDLIAKQALPPDERPSYSVPETKSSDKISKDFESYLILQSADDKQNILSWINSLKKVDSALEDRDAILKRYLDIRAEDAAQIIQDVDKDTGDFNKFKASLAPGEEGKPSRWTELLELNLLARALQRPIDEILIQRETAFHEENMLKLVQILLDVKAFGKDTSQELKQWQAIIGAYKGQDE